MTIEDNTGVGMPGGDNEQFLHGVDLNGVWQGVPPLSDERNGVMGGSESGLDVSGGAVLDPGLGTSGASLFNDGEKPYDASGADSMQGVSGLDNIHVEILSDAEMYASQLEPTFEPIAETANPLLLDSDGR